MSLPDDPVPLPARREAGMMRRLTIDIETRPNLAHVWGLWDQNVGINQLIEPVEMICFAAKWYHQKSVEFYSVHHDGIDVMRAQAYRLLNEADVIIHYNGRSFDIPHLNRELILGGYQLALTLPPGGPPNYHAETIQVPVQQAGLRR